MPHKPARQVLAETLTRLMRESELKQKDVASGTVSQRTVSSLANPEGNSPTLDKIEGAAHALQMEAWQLLINPESVDPRTYQMLMSLRIGPPRLRRKPLSTEIHTEAKVNPKKRRG